MYKRILLKLSGEQLSGKFEHGIDPEVIGWLADEVKQVSALGVEVIIVVGGGNIVRGSQVVGHGIQRVTADHMGMLGTMINALALTDIFEAHNVRTRCLSNIFAEQVAEPFVHRLAHKHLQKGRVVVVAGGIGRPYLTTDTAAVSLALELGCDLVMKATKVKGVYDNDPTLNPDAKRYEQLSYQKALGNKDIKIVDKAAMGLAMEHQMPLVVFDAFESGNILKVIQNVPVGTRVG